MLNFGEIYYADLTKLSCACGMHIQSGMRPVLVISNDLCNYFSCVITIVPLTSRIKKTDLPTHVVINGNGLEKTSMALCEQIITIDKRQLLRKIGRITSKKTLNRIRRALLVQLNAVRYYAAVPKKFEKKCFSDIRDKKKTVDLPDIVINEKTYLWLGRIYACERSGGTKIDWCRRNGVSYKTFMNRQTQFRHLGLI